MAIDVCEFCVPIFNFEDEGVEVWEVCLRQAGDFGALPQEAIEIERKVYVVALLAIEAVACVEEGGWYAHSLRSVGALAGLAGETLLDYARRWVERDPPEPAPAPLVEG